MKNRDDLICENLGLVYACARKFIGRGVEYEELCSCGTIGLIKAADRFDESLGFQFSTYAVPVILGEMKRIFRDSGAIKVSRSLRELNMRATAAKEEFEARFLREPALSELAEVLSVSEEELSEALSASMLPLSLSGCVDGEEETFDIPVESDEEKLSEKLTLEALIEKLPESDREIIKLRYFQEKTQSVTAEILGMSQVQVSRREKKILLSLREKMLC